MSEFDEGNVVISSETQRFIEVFVNGRSQGKQPLNGSPSIKEVATQLAQQHGIRTFTVSVDDNVVTNDMAHLAAQPDTRFSVQAKDSRGGKAKKKLAAAPEPAPTPAPASSEGSQDAEYEEVKEPPTDNDAEGEQKAS